MLDFPNNPAPQSGDTYQAPNGQLYFFDGDKWIGFGEPTPGANVDLTEYATINYVDQQIAANPGPQGDPGPVAYQQGDPFNFSTLTHYNANDVVSYGGSFWILSDYANYIQSYTPDTYIGWAPFNLAPAGANGVGVPTGGTTGQILAKIDETNYNTEWINNVVVPTDVSAFTNDSGYITGYTETDTLDSVTDRGASTDNDITVGNIYPSGTSNTKYLGSPTQRWHTLYVGPGSIDIDGTAIKSNAGALSFSSDAGLPPTVIVISGADWPSANGTYTRQLGTSPAKWVPDNYNPGSDSYIEYDGGWGIKNPAFGQAVYVNTGTLNKPLAQWNTNPPLGSVAPIGEYTYSNPSLSFGTDGALTLPQGSKIVDGTAPAFGYKSIDLYPGDAPYPDQYLRIYPTNGGDANHLHLTSGDLQTTELFLGNDNHYVKLGAGGNVNIRAGAVSSASEWSFSTNGSLTFPDDTTQNTAAKQADWTQTTDTALDYIKNKPTLFDGNYDSLTNKPDLTAYYLATNPSGYTSNTGTVTSVSGTGTVSGLTLSGTVTSTGNLTLGGTLSVALSSLTDVQFVGSPSTGQVLKYDSDSGKWYNGSDNTGGGGGGGLSYSDFSVGTPNAASGSGAISYNNTNGVFKYTPPDLSSYATQTYVTSQGYTTNTGTVTSVSGTGTVNGLTLTGTVTSSGSLTLGGTLGSIGNSQLTNSTISGVALGSNLFDLTISSPLSGTSYNGSSAATIALATGYGDTQNPYASKTANYVLAAPNGTAGAPTFRALVAGDIPALSYVTSVGGTGTVNGITLSGTVTSSGSLTLGGTLSGIGNSQLTNSSITVNGQSISLGGSGTITATATNALTIGTGLGGTSYNGSTAVTITNTGVTSVTAGTGISVSASTGGVTISASGSPTFTNITTTGQIIETFQTYSTNINSGATVTLNCAGGNLWNITSTVAGNWTAALTNLSITTGQATNVTLIINQGSTPYIVNALTVNSTSVTINWQGGSAPTGNASKKDAMAFSIMQTGASTYLVFGQLVTFG